MCIRDRLPLTSAPAPAAAPLLPASGGRAIAAPPPALASAIAAPPPAATGGAPPPPPAPELGSSSFDEGVNGDAIEATVTMRRGGQLEPSESGGARCVPEACRDRPMR
eukprot:8582413-Pyramimonas_sp.AAC.1